MSSEELEAARAAFDRASRLKDPAGKRIDTIDPETMDAIVDFFHPEIEFHEDPRFPEAGVYKGSEAARNYFKAFGESFDEFTFEAEDFIDLGEGRVLILFRIRTRGKGSGARSEVDSGWIFTVRDGKTVRIVAYFDRNEAFEAAGLGSPGQRG